MEDNFDNEGNYTIEYWRRKATDWEWLYRDQKDITMGYRKIVEELQQEIQDLKNSQEIN